MHPLAELMRWARFPHGVPANLAVRLVVIANWAAIAEAKIADHRTNHAYNFERGAVLRSAGRGACIHRALLRTGRREDRTDGLQHASHPDLDRGR